MPRCTSAIRAAVFGRKIDDSQSEKLGINSMREIGVESKEDTNV